VADKSQKVEDKLNKLEDKMPKLEDKLLKVDDKSPKQEDKNFHIKNLALVTTYRAPFYNTYVNLFTI
jgi:hypothetical protein